MAAAWTQNDKVKVDSPVMYILDARTDRYGDTHIRIRKYIDMHRA